MLWPSDYDPTESLHEDPYAKFEPTDEDFKTMTHIFYIAWAIALALFVLGLVIL